jgi:hypothetical protein
MKASSLIPNNIFSMLQLFESERGPT